MAIREFSDETAGPQGGVRPGGRGSGVRHSWVLMGTPEAADL